MILIYGTTNNAKLRFMKRRIEPLGIEILSLDDIGAPKLDIDESGNDPLENAKIKALAYYKALNAPVFSCDSGLYFDGIENARQPGVHVRCVNGKRLDDDGMIAHYSGLAAEFGGRITARYKNAICLVMNGSEIYEHMGEDIASEPFYIVSAPHEKRREGFPLDSLSVHIQSGQYYYERGNNEGKYSDSDDGFAAFFKRVLMETRAE